ncbi:MAG: AMP-binding protein [Candidatus Omnitrophica bacterium]|nr:AMP-binding protein [Candidatus Omnitrophota bacterium]
MGFPLEYERIGFVRGKSADNNVISFFDFHAAQCPERTALQWVPQETLKSWDGSQPLAHELISYGEMSCRIRAIAAGLAHTGIRAGDRVIVFLPLSLEMYMSMFAVQRIGAIAVFLDSWARRDHLRVCADVVEPKAMISFERAFQLSGEVAPLAEMPLKIVAGPHQAEYNARLEALVSGPAENNITPVEGNDTALITFTTGSSGVPKGANRTHRFLAAQHRALDKVIPYRIHDRDFPVFPIFSLNNFAGGVTTVLPAIDLANPSEKDPAMLVNQIHEAEVTCCTVSPSLFVQIAEYCLEQDTILGGIRRVVTGGAPVSRENVDRMKTVAPGANILVLYGSTEVEPIAHIEAEEMLRDESAGEGVNVGRISEDLDWKLIRLSKTAIELTAEGWDEWEVEHGGTGELVVSGPHVCQGYYRNPDAFTKTKIKDPNAKVWHRTGDVGRVDEQERLWLVGRVHNAIVRNGEYLFPVQAEILLKGFAFVRQAAFLGIEDARLGEKACAVISLRPEYAGRDRCVIEDEIAQLFAQQHIPVDDVIIVDHIPMDPRHHSKVEYAKLRELIV